MFILKKRIDRRTFLRGMGASVALPMLDAMIPVRSLLVRPVPRLAFIYFPHGAIMDEWTPAAAGHTLQLGRILEPLTPFRNQLTIVSGLENRHAFGPVHAITPGTWLSGTSPSVIGEASTSPSRRRGNSMLGATADQMAADRLGQDTPLRSMAVATEESKTIGAGFWQGLYDESYGSTISFRRAHLPVPMEFRPRAVFDTLFHSTSDPTSPRKVRAAGTADRAATVADRQMRAAGVSSVLDLVAADAARLRNRLGPADRAVLGEYLETIRDVERRVDKVEEWEQAKVDVEDQFKERMRLMFDMIALAFRADVTRVASVMMAAEASSMTYDHLGVPDSFHLLSHHQNDPEKIEKLVRIQTFHTRMVSTFVGTLAALPDGDGSILDRSLILFGSNTSDSHAHNHFPLPLTVIGGGCGTHRGRQHLRYPDRTPMSNLLLTLLHRAGVPVESVGDSTCECTEL